MRTQLLENETCTRFHIDKLLDYAERFGRNIQLVNGCREPGYGDKPVALANWNDKSHYDEKNRRYVIDNNTMSRIARLLKKLGYETEWEDEWSVCDECGKAVRTSPDCYGWKPYCAIFGNCVILCGDCVKENPEDYLAELSGNPRKCLTLDIPLDKYGYRLYDSEYEAGFHDGQTDDPKAIAKELQGKGITDFIFVLDSQGQFNCSFSVWIKPQGN